jgi:hypothetical protein
MKWVAMLIAIAVVVASTAPGELLAQGTPTSPTTPATGIKPDRTIADPATRKATREKGRIAKEARRLPQSGAATKSGADQAARLHQGLHVAFMSRD